MNWTRCEVMGGELSCLPVVRGWDRQ